jgi:mRNA-degrading endonuclease RelE of RelBE toxin-antitoxin system
LTWKIIISEQAFGQLKKLRRTPQYALFEKAIRELEQSDDPTTLGTFKQGTNLRCYAYNVTKSLRLLYTIDREGHLIVIIALGDHKQLYGKD